MYEKLNSVRLTPTFNGWEVTIRENVDYSPKTFKKCFKTLENAIKYITSLQVVKNADY